LSPLNIVIANINFIIYCNDMPLLIEPQPASYEPFFIEKTLPITGSPTIDILLETNNFPSTEELTEIFEDCGSWSMFKKGNEYSLVLNPSLAGGPECIARFNPCFEKVTVYCGDMDIVEVAGKKFIRNPFTYPLDQLLLMHVLAERGGALIHASGVDFYGRGFILSGRSGAGKSTLSRKFALEGNDVLSDDRVVVRKIGNEFRMFGTPWSGEAGIAKNKDLLLHGIFFIHHGGNNFIRKISPAEAVERLMPVTSIPWYDETMMAKILTFCEELVSLCPAYDLFFRPDIDLRNTFKEFIPT
jgi:hypothetical protein